MWDLCHRSCFFESTCAVCPAPGAPRQAQQLLKRRERQSRAFGENFPMHKTRRRKKSLTCFFFFICYFSSLLYTLISFFLFQYNIIFFMFASPFSLSSLLESLLDGNNTRELRTTALLFTRRTLEIRSTSLTLDERKPTTPHPQRTRPCTRLGRAYTQDAHLFLTV